MAEKDHAAVSQTAMRKSLKIKVLKMESLTLKKKKPIELSQRTFKNIF